jgi:sugar/nucleoside kinase (ribokinase family)
MRIAGAGCCLMDVLYPKVDFSSAAFSAAASRREGDGGLIPGRLVFVEDAERFTGKSFAETLRSILGSPSAAAGEEPVVNVGGPSVVSLVHASQMLEGEGIPVAFYGTTGDDATGAELRDRLALTPLDSSGLGSRPGRTPSTFVLSDPEWDSGRGERCFVNDIGAAEGYLPTDLGEGFFDASIVALGGTALVPGLHDGLPGILAMARSRGALTFVNTVFDFRAERKDSVGAWPLGGSLRSQPGGSLRSQPGGSLRSQPGGSLRPQPGGSLRPGPAESYEACDLLVMDRDEALRLSGERELAAALRFFARSGIGAFAVTRGGESVLAWAGKGRFAPLGLTELPVSERAARSRDAGASSGGDTTGCGDAFAGGIIAALALQIAGGAPRLDLAEAISWGIAAGAFTLSFLGGTYYESSPGEKRELVAAYREDWLKQTG